jgi:antitoxin PrlF
MYSYIRAMNRRATVGERGQVTIPKPFRDRLGIRPGEAVEFIEDQGRLVVQRMANRDPVEDVYGVLDLGRGTDVVMRELRGEDEPDSGSDVGTRGEPA